MNGDAAEEVVRMVLNGADITIRLVGAGAKNLAALLIAWAKQEKIHVGKTSLPKLLSSGDELHVLSLTEKQYEGFNKLAKKNITYAPFLNTKTRDGKVDIVLGARQLGFANHILSKVGYRNIEPGSGARSEILNERDKEELGMSFDSPAGDSKKNDTPSRSGSSECRDSSQGRDDLRRSNRKPSVEKKLEENRRLLERDRGKQKERSRDKSPAKTKTKSTGKER